MLDHVGLPIRDSVAPMWGGSGGQTLGDVDVRQLLPFHLHFSVSLNGGTVRYMGERPLSGLNYTFLTTQVAACEVPLDILAEWVPYGGLKELARQHHIDIEWDACSREW